MLAAVGAVPQLKLVIAVDHDVDIYDDSAMLAALARRFQPIDARTREERYTVVRAAKGATYDPSSFHREYPNSKLLIDATISSELSPEERAGSRRRTPAERTTSTWRHTWGTTREGTIVSTPDINTGWHDRHRGTDVRGGYRRHGRPDLRPSASRGPCQGRARDRCVGPPRFPGCRRPAHAPPDVRQPLRHQHPDRNEVRGRRWLHDDHPDAPQSGRSRRSRSSTTSRSYRGAVERYATIDVAFSAVVGTDRHVADLRADGPRARDLVVQVLHGLHPGRGVGVRHQRDERQADHRRAAEHQGDRLPGDDDGPRREHVDHPRPQGEVHRGGPQRPQGVDRREARHRRGGGHSPRRSGMPRETGRGSTSCT